MRSVFEISEVWFKKNYIAVLSLIVLSVVLFTRFPSSNWNRVIVSDGKGYYAYLPAILIYQDLDYQFIDQLEKKYYGDDDNLKKGFVKIIDGRSVNQYFIGLSILWIPFFILAHLLSVIIGLPPDGYNIIYQISIAISGVFYGMWGLWSSGKVLKYLNIKDSFAAVTLSSLLLGTNLFHYMTDGVTMSHVYNFALISSFLWLLFVLKEKKKVEWLVIISIVYALIVLVRPTNAIVLLFIPFVFRSTSEYTEMIDRIGLKGLFTGVLSGVLVLFLQFLVWKLQSGNWLVDSYEGEGFNFGSPEIIKSLFSVRKGWFVYTPLALLIIPGWILYYRKERVRALILLLILIISVYIISSWHLWAYADSFGQRPFVDYYVVITILIGFFFSYLEKKNTVLKLFVWAFVVACVALNQFQTYQMRKGIIPRDHMTASLYVDTFLQTRPKTRLISDTSSMTLISEQIAVKQVKEQKNGRECYQLNSQLEFGELLQTTQDSFQGLVVIEGSVYVNSNDMKLYFVVEVLDSLSQTIEYQSFDTKRYLKSNEWSELAFELRLKTDQTSVIRSYFWLPVPNNKVWLDDQKMKLYR